MVTHTQDTCNIMINNSGSVSNTEEGTCILFGVGCTWVLQANKPGHVHAQLSIIQRFDIRFIPTYPYYIHTLLIPGVDKIGTIH